MRRTPDRAQSESIGIILLVGVVVISVSTFGVYYVATTTGGTGGSAAGSGVNTVNLEVSATTDELKLTHSGGASVSTDGLQVQIQNDTGEYTYELDEDALSGDGDGQLEAGETWQVGWNQSIDTEVTVSLVDGDGQVVSRDSVTVEPVATDRPANPAS